jgi:hypothetical protein
LAEIVPVVSEALEAQVRDLLPSQRGFTEDLQASNVITPIIDLTAAAEGSTTPIYQAQAIAFGSQTAFDVTNANTTIANSPGFYRIFGCVTNVLGGAGSLRPSFEMTDGLSVKKVWGMQGGIASGNQQTLIDYDFVVFLATGISLTANSPSTGSVFVGSVRQVADVNGTVVNPVGFTPQ